jgi:hypothetical protein
VVLVRVFDIMVCGPDLIVPVCQLKIVHWNINRLTQVPSRYTELVFVRWRARKAPAQAENFRLPAGQVVRSVLVPLVPPIRMCESHMPAEPGLLPATFHSMTIAPAAGACVVKL